MRAADLKPGDEVYRWHDAGCAGADLEPLLVLRVNCATVRCEDLQGRRGRVPIGEIAGRLPAGRFAELRAEWQAGRLPG